MLIPLQWLRKIAALVLLKYYCNSSFWKIPLQFRIGVKRFSIILWAIIIKLRQMAWDKYLFFSAIQFLRYNFEVIYCLNLAALLLEWSNILPGSYKKKSSTSSRLSKTKFLTKLKTQKLGLQKVQSKKHKMRCTIVFLKR